jgi:N-acetylmuramoyl-L-alanine amidase
MARKKQFKTTKVDEPVASEPINALELLAAERHPATQDEQIQPQEEPEQLTLETPPRTPHTWILDAGHGPRTAGKRSPVLPDGRQLIEWEWNRRVLDRIIELAGDEFDIRVTIPDPARTGDDLQRRCDAANSVRTELPRVFVSIHSNAAPTPRPGLWAPPSGVEVWHFHTSRKGMQLAQVFLAHLVERTGRRDRKIKSKPFGQFKVLTGTHMPAILTEGGFYTNREECELMLTDAYMDAVALAHVEAMRAWEFTPDN